jgi:transcriptional regulator with XRE-family HTH domain
VLGGLSWGDNVVWEHDSASPPDAFFKAIHGQAGDYDHAAYVTVHADPAQIAERYPDFELIDARPGTAINQPGRLLAAVQQACVPGRNLMVFDPLEAMGDQWGEDIAVRFFVRCCPALLSIGAIAYWSLSLEGRVGRLRRDLEDVTQCVLVLRDGRLQIAKAEGRPVSVQGSVYRCRIVDGMPELEHAPAAARVGAALRSLRRRRGLSQRELADLAAVTPSAISQAEHGRRGLSLDTVLDLATSLNITLDELLRGESAGGYRLGRREDPAAEATGRPVPLLDDPDAGLRAYLIRLPPGGAGKPTVTAKGVELVAVITGLVQVVLSTGRPVLRQGDALLADRDAITGWRINSHHPAAALWVIRDG